MDFYLIFKNNRYQVITNPSEEVMKEAEVIFRTLEVDPPFNRGYLRLLPAAAADMITRSQREIFLPKRISSFNRFTHDFGEILPSEIRAHWEVFIRLGLSALTMSAPINMDAR